MLLKTLKKFRKPGKNLKKTSGNPVYKICSKELFIDKINKIKLILNKNSYPQKVVNKTIKLHSKSLDKTETAEPEKCLITLSLPHVNKNSRVIEKDFSQLISKSYHSAKLRVIFLLRPMIRPGGKNPISEYKKSIIVYQFNCFCEDSFVGMTFRQFGERIKEQILKSIDKFCIARCRPSSQNLLPVRYFLAKKKLFKKHQNK